MQDIRFLVPTNIFGTPPFVIIRHQATSNFSEFWPRELYLLYPEAVLAPLISIVQQVVQVYTYMVNPLGVGGQDGGPAAAPGVAPAVQQPPQQDPAQAAAPGRQPSSSSVSRVTGWELRLVMEYCNAVSDVRAALCCAVCSALLHRLVEL